MKPGHDLDSLIAEKVMGFEVIPLVNQEGVTFGPYKIRYVKTWYRELDNQSFNDETLPKYSTDIPATWEVVEKLISMDYMVDIQTHTKFHQVQLDKLVGETDKGGIWQGGESVDGESTPHAICLAALKAVGVKID